MTGRARTALVGVALASTVLWWQPAPGGQERRTQAPDGVDSYGRAPDGSVVVDGMAALRTLNRRLGTAFPLDGPKTLNGLVVGRLGEIPEAGTRVEIAGQALEILQTQDRGIKVVRLLPPVGREALLPLQGNEGRASSVG